MPRTSTESLFRRAALVAINDRPLGHVICPIPAAWTWITVFLVSALGTLLALAPHIEWYRTEAVRGWLVPSAGVVRVTSSTKGVVSSRAVETGQRVDAGDVLAVITTEIYRVDGTSRRQRDRKHLAAAIEDSHRRESLLDQRNSLLLKEAEERQHLLAAELQSIDRQLRHELQRHDIEERRLKRISAAGTAVPTFELLKQQEGVLVRSAAIEELRQRRIRAEGELGALRTDIAGIPVDTKIAKSKLFAERTLLQKQLDGSESEVALLAPVPGRVADMSLSVGDVVHPGATLISILPSGVELHAELHVPSKSSAYLEVGQPVRLFIDAWPREKFGAIAGTVDRVSEYVAETGDEPKRKSYRVIVRFDSIDRSLRPGMTLGAELLLERRNLVDWFIGPLRSRFST